MIFMYHCECLYVLCLFCVCLENGRKEIGFCLFLRFEKKGEKEEICIIICSHSNDTSVECKIIQNA